ncbi:MarR family transcriptional regulator [Lichenihabitans sp. Uapishka_5]|uniref:MarR family winged helix-turn-helix transcriptional regulator n=1 Tax=Lichenihabitans sp. Uapishka_5 TaxID=3037302 RepID=UPI0029E7EFF1|nr:MarR family transcriptional regulator [Lichenihabitans sp. Uapishka_5]MDX7951759.1 MarR family transcriptional regulator [Lichenihabitans sp. Uapishka_5]
MAAAVEPSHDNETEPQPYRLDEQIGFILRQVVQRHAAIFASGMDQALTAPQWAALAKLAECGPLSQNQLGRLIVTDAATIKGVVDRLSARVLTRTSPDPDDRRRYVVELTPIGLETVARLSPHASAITAETLAPLDAAERTRLLALLRKLC